MDNRELASVIAGVFGICIVGFFVTQCTMQLNRDTKMKYSECVTAGGSYVDTLTSDVCVGGRK